MMWLFFSVLALCISGLAAFVLHLRTLPGKAERDALAVRLVAVETLTQQMKTALSLRQTVEKPRALGTL